MGGLGAGRGDSGAAAAPAWSDQAEKTGSKSWGTQPPSGGLLGPTRHVGPAAGRCATQSLTLPPSAQGSQVTVGTQMTSGLFPQRYRQAAPG